MKIKKIVSLLKKEPLPGDLQRIFKLHCRGDVGNAKTGERPDDLDQGLFILGIKYCQRCVPADKKVPVDELYFRWVPEMLPQLDHLVSIFRFELEPQYKQHVSSPHSTDYPYYPELREYYAGEENGKPLTMFQGIDKITIRSDIVSYRKWWQSPGGLVPKEYPLTQPGEYP